MRRYCGWLCTIWSYNPANLLDLVARRLLLDLSTILLDPTSDSSSCTIFGHNWFSASTRVLGRYQVRFGILPQFIGRSIEFIK